MKTPFLTFYYDIDESLYYEKSANNLKEQIESFGGNLIVKNPKLTSSYNLNCLYKPQIILETLKSIECPLIWIDADCDIREIPLEYDSISKNVDIVCVLREEQKITPHSAVIYFNYNKNVINFLEKWINECKKFINNQYFNDGDHSIFINLIKNEDLNIGLISPLMASVLYSNSKIKIKISPGGFETEEKKKMKYVTFLNSGCIDICKNMIKSAENVGINSDDFFIACLDKNAYEEFKNYKNCFLWCDQKIKEYQDWTFDPNSGFRSIVKNKWAIIKHVYEKHQRLCWVDTDIVFKKNPSDGLKNDEKILFQCDRPGSWICSGFMVFNNSIECQNLINECANNQTEDDQLLINHIGLTKYHEHIALLSTEQFPNGHIYYNVGIKDQAYIVHNNHMVGIQTKINKFKEENLWFI
jgi:hypothetical protein